MPSSSIIAIFGAKPPAPGLHLHFVKRAVVGDGSDEEKLGPSSRRETEKESPLAMDASSHGNRP